MLFKKNQFKRLTEITNMALPLYDVILVRKIKPQKGVKNKLLEVVAITFQENEEIPIFIDKISSKCEMISILQKENEDNVKILYFEDKNYTQLFLNNADYKFKFIISNNVKERKIINIEVVKNEF